MSPSLTPLFTPAVPRLAHLTDTSISFETHPQMPSPLPGGAGEALLGLLLPLARHMIVTGTELNRKGCML